MSIRVHGVIRTRIWADEDFVALDAEAQRLYLFLLSQSDLSHAGLLPLRIRRWAKKVAGGTVASITAALDRLADARFVLYDIDTEEALVRTFVRNDGVYKQPKVMLRLREDAKEIESPRLRAAFAAEIDRWPLGELSDKPGGPNGDQPSTRATVTEVVEAIRNDFANSTEGVSDTHSDTPHVRAPAFPQPPTPSPLPPTPVPPTAADAAAPGDDPRPADSAQTLVAEWIEHCDDRPPSRVIGQLSKEIKGLLAEGIPYPEVRAAVAAWHAKGLHPSTLASVVQENRAARTPKQSTTEARMNEGLALARRLAAEEAAAEQRQIGA